MGTHEHEIIKITFYFDGFLCRVIDCIDCLSLLLNGLIVRTLRIFLLASISKKKFAKLFIRPIKVESYVLLIQISGSIWTSRRTASLMMTRCVNAADTFLLFTNRILVDGEPIYKWHFIDKLMALYLHWMIDWINWVFAEIQYENKQIQLDLHVFAMNKKKKKEE